MLRGAGSIVQSQSDRNVRNEVDVGDVDKDLGGVERELAKAEVDVVVRVGLIEDAGFDEAGAGVEEESERRAD